VIISAPSGGGKDTVIHRLVKELDDAVVYVTATSRKPRPGEQDGVDYYFYEPEKFRAEIEAGNFLEWSMVHGDFKGVRKDALADTLRDHRIVIVKPEPQGMRKIKAKLPEALTVFIMPPSLESLRKRLVERGTETDEWGSDFKQVAGSEGFPGGHTSPEVTLRSQLGYTGTDPRQQMLENKSFIDAKAELFVKYGSTQWTRVGEYPVKRQLITR